jgi:hypothetical protein
LKKYDTFLILTAGRFTENDLALAKRVKSYKKSFFCIRTKIDQDYVNEKRKKAFNQEEMLKDIREDCLENLKGLEEDDEIVFLVSNAYQKRWDFPRLKKAILGVLPLRQKECITLTLSPLTREMLKEKANLLRGSYYRINLEGYVRYIFQNWQKVNILLRCTFCVKLAKFTTKLVVQPRIKGP